MKVKALIASVAFMALGTALAAAAELPVKAPPPPPPPPVFSWTGFYIGGNIGGAWANNEWTETFFHTNFNNDRGVFIGGGQIGVNYQIGQFVIGGEWDGDWGANNNNNVAVAVPGVGLIAVTSNNRWITTVAARFGFTVDRWLVYGKAGGGWVGNNNLTVTNLTTGVSLTCGTFTTLTNCGNNTGGWLLGVGVEYAFANNWTVKFEYDYLGLGNRTLFIPATAAFLPNDTFNDFHRNVQMVKVGFNYLFNWGAPRY
jgi:outer membrane immunogenic protein